MFVDRQCSNNFQDDIEKPETVAMTMGLLAEISSASDNAQPDGDYPEPDLPRDLTHPLTFNPDLLRQPMTAKLTFSRWNWRILENDLDATSPVLKEMVGLEPSSMMGSECSILLNQAYSLLNDLSVFIFFPKA